MPIVAAPAVAASANEGHMRQRGNSAVSLGRSYTGVTTEPKSFPTWARWVDHVPEHYETRVRCRAYEGLHPRVRRLVKSYTELAISR